jgi:hypothetical protein
VAIREGQDSGLIGAKNNAATMHREAHRGVDNISVLPSPSDFAPKHELVATNGGIYDMTDDVSDEEFDAIITEAKSEGNLSRSNVVRKIENLPTFSEQQAAKWNVIRDLANDRLTSAQIATRVGMPERGLREGARREGDESALDLVGFEDITPEQAAEWLQRLASRLRALNRTGTPPIRTQALTLRLGFGSPPRSCRRGGPRLRERARVRDRIRDGDPTRRRGRSVQRRAPDPQNER